MLPPPPLLHIVCVVPPVMLTPSERNTAAFFARFVFFFVLGKGGSRHVHVLFHSEIEALRLLIVAIRREWTLPLHSLSPRRIDFW